MSKVVSPKTASKKRGAAPKAASGSSDAAPKAASGSSDAAPRTALRGAPVVQDIIQATLLELGRVGFQALRVEDVASAAGVHKTTIYRRFPTKEELVLETLRHMFAQSMTMPDHGNLREDLVEVGVGIAGFLVSDKGKAFARLLMTEGSDGQLRKMIERLRSKRDSLPVRILERAKQRGELPAHADIEALLFALVGSLQYTTHAMGQQVDRAAVTALVDMLLYGVLNTAPAGQPGAPARTTSGRGSR